MKSDQQILIIGFVWPEPNSSAAGTRMLQLIELFLNQNWKVTFASAATDSDFMFDLSSMGVATEKITLNCDSFDAFIQKLKPTIVLFDRFMIEEQFGWRIVNNCPNALRMLDTEDLHMLRVARQKAFKENRLFEVKDLLEEEIAKREIASILRCDSTLLVSEFETSILKSVFNIDPSLLYYLPIFVDQEDAALRWEHFNEKINFMFIGNFLHDPNWNAVQYLKESIWPKIRKGIPNAIVNIYGAYPSQKVYHLHNEKEGFIIKGRAESSEEVFRETRVVLAPIRFGAGIKGKLLEAMQYGTPSVTTSIGAEAMKGDLPWNGFITDEADTFAQHAIDLYANEDLWNRSRQNGLAILKSRYQRQAFETNFIDHILSIQKNLKQHRKNNFFGAMLQFHTLRSTEFMSRWIQEKNKTNSC